MYYWCLIYPGLFLTLTGLCDTCRIFIDGTHRIFIDNMIDILSYECSYMLRLRALSRAHIYNNYIVVQTICVGRKALDVSFGERERKSTGIQLEIKPGTF